MELSKIYLYRMTHIDNVDHILAYGITHKKSAQANPYYRTIGDNSLISRRDNFITDSGRELGDYIPFYFGPRTPMLYVIQKGYNGVRMTPAEEIVYCVTSLAKIIESNLDYIYADGHATDGFTKFFSMNDMELIDSQVDFEATNANYWKKENDLDFKRRKEAELLILGDLAIEFNLGFIVFNEKAKEALVQKGIDDKLVVIKPNNYF